MRLPSPTRQTEESSWRAAVLMTEVQILADIFVKQVDVPNGT